jgi:hypothetical protein
MKLREKWLEDTEREIRSKPGLRIRGDMLTKAEAEALAKITDRDLEWDSVGNHVFMPKDAKEVARIRKIWNAVGLA